MEISFWFCVLLFGSGLALTLVYFVGFSNGL